ncbi:GNAT family N-acetyltransferase [Brevibacillus sp. SYSU BS000544]|uniref:GNAT family N-acetyltransferase n=1 Tax=Brevibacillus sp. SYSU BS000544 TaxID=3416443 RepID=UPI003CE4DA4D
MNGIHLLNQEHLSDFVSIAGNAYPGLNMTTADNRQRWEERLLQRMQEEAIHFFGYFRDGQLLGGMILYDYLMNIRSVQIPVGGVGMVAVDFLHKKEKIAKELITYFLHHYREQDCALTALYPFRPDFYKQMGFCFGTKNNQYRVQPSTFPNSGNKSHLVYLTKEDREAIQSCHDRYFAQTHGMFRKTNLDMRNMIENPDNRIVGYVEDGQLLGYMVFSFKSVNENNFVLNNMLVKELTCETPEAWKEFCTFLHSQADQIHRVVITTQDEHLHHLFNDPRDGAVEMIPHVSHQTNVSAAGIMYRLVNSQALWTSLSNVNFGGITCKLRLNIRDSFLPVNSESTVIHFTDGRPRLAANPEDYEVELSLDITEFTALLLGIVPFTYFVRNGLVQISNPSYTDIITRLFHTVEKPICTTMF